MIIRGGTLIEAPEAVGCTDRSMERETQISRETERQRSKYIDAGEVSGESIREKMYLD